MTKDLLASISIWKCYISKDVLYFVELISSNCFKIWINLYDLLVLTTISFTNTSWLQSFLKQRFLSVPWKRTSKSYLFNFIYLFMFGWPWFEPGCMPGQLGEDDTTGIWKIHNYKVTGKYIHYFVHYMTASFRMLHVFFLEWELIIKVLIENLLPIQELLER